MEYSMISSGKKSGVSSVGLSVSRCPVSPAVRTIAPSCPLAKVYLREIRSTGKVVTSPDRERNRIVLSAESIDQTP